MVLHLLEFFCMIVDTHFLWSWNPRPVGFSSHGADGESLLWICESLAGKEGLESWSLDFLAGKGGRPPCCLVLFVLMSLGRSYPLLIPSHFVLHPFSIRSSVCILSLLTN